MEARLLKVILLYLGLTSHLTEGVDPCTGLGGAVALGMESNFIQSTQIKASSTCNCTTHPPEDARYMSAGSWTSAIADDMQFLQIDLEIRHFIRSVRIQGRPDYPQFVRYFNLEYSYDPLGYEFDYVPDDINPNIAKELEAIALDDDIDYATYITSHTDEEKDVVVDVGPLRFVRFYPTNWTHHIAMRVELFGCTDVDTTVQISSLTEPITGSYGQTVQLVCDAQGYRSPSITWYDPNDDIMQNDARIAITETEATDFMFVTSTLTINYYQESDNGDYKCNATHEEYLTNAIQTALQQTTRPDSGTLPTLSGGITPTEVKFYNNYFYEFSTATANLADAKQYCLDRYGYLAKADEIAEQHFLRAFIATPVGDPLEKYWVDYSGNFNTVHGVYSNSELLFSQLLESNLHRYVCKYGEVSVSKESLPSYPLWSSTNFEMVCTITSNPTPDVKWYKDDIEMVWNPPVGNVATLVADPRFTWDTSVPNVHKLTIASDFLLDDLATYRCEGDNDYFTAFEEHNLPPGTFPHLLVRHSGDFAFGIGNDIELICEAACYPHASVHWEKGDNNVTDNLPHLEIVESTPNETSNIITLTLKINDLVAADVGLYKCVVENEKGPSGITFEIPADGDVSDNRDLSLSWYAVDKLVVENETGSSVIAQVSATVDADENRSLADDELVVGESFLKKVEDLSNIQGSRDGDLDINLKNVLNIARGLVSSHQVHQTQSRSLDVILSAEIIYTQTAVTLQNGTDISIALQGANSRVISTYVTTTTELSATFDNVLGPESTQSSDDDGNTSSYTDGRQNSIELDSLRLQSRYLGAGVTFSALYFNDIKTAIVNDRKRRSITVLEPRVSTQVNSGVMSCRVTADSDLVTDIPIEYKLANKQDVIAENIDTTKEVGKRLIYSRELTTQMEAMCRFWNYANDDWDDDGLHLTETETDEGETACYSTHTTNFAVLMQVTEIEISSTNAKALEIITYIGCGISIATLLFTIILFQWLDTLRSERTTIHKNLIIAIILAQVVFLAGINATHNWVACMCVAIILHFCYLAVFTWMLVEGIHLYSKVVQVFGSETSKLKYYVLIGWGVPLVIVAISAAANYKGYGTEKHCWLDIASGQIWSFVAPALLIIVVNLVVLGMVVRIVINSAKMQKEKEYDHIKAGVKGALVLLPILGLTWVFGLFAVDEGSLVFQYLFAIFNSLQGFFIFLFQCAFNSEVRAAYQRKKEKRALARGDFVTSTSGTHGGYETANRTTKTAVTSFSSSMQSSDTSNYGRESPGVFNRKGSQSSGENLIKDDDSVISTSKVKLKDKQDTSSYKSPSSPLPGTVEEEDDVEIVNC